MPVQHWFTYPNLDPVALHLGPLSVRWYGLSYLFGFLAVGAWLARPAGRRRLGLTTDGVLDFLFYALLGVLFGGAAMSTLAGCANPAGPSCSAGCLGSDNVCYTCASGSTCASARINSDCSSPSAGGIYCCGSTTTGGGSTGSGCPCASGQAYNPQFGKCCPGDKPWYDPGGHGYSAGCYVSCPYVGDCGNTYTRCN